MRKVLSIVLALAMVLGCFASVFAAEFTDVKTTDDFATAVSVLTDLNVVSGYTDGTYRPEKVVTRAEMAALLIKALGLTPAASSTTNFSDVPASHWASGYVAYANSLGIIAGYTDGTFKPSKTVSYDEAVTMIVQALGYTADSLEGTTWPTAFIMKAQQLKITKGVELLGSVGANRGDIAELLYNTLGCPIGKTNKDGDFVANGTKTEPDNMLTRLGATKKAADVITGTEPAAISLAEYVGAYVTPYYKDKEIVAVEVLSTKLEGEYKTATAGETFAGKSFAKGCTFDFVQFENGEVGTCEKKDATVMEVELDSTGKISAVYSVQKWAGETFMASKTAYDAKKFTLTNDGKTYTFKVEDEALVEDSFVLLGADSLDKIAEDDVVTVYVGPTSKNVTKVEVSNEVVTGKITAKTEKKITVNGTAYAFADVPVKQQGEFDFTNEFNLYFDYAGNLVFVQPVEAAVTLPDYAVVLEANYESTGDGWTGTTATVTRQVKLLLTTGEEVVYDVAKSPETEELLFESKGDDKTTSSAAIFMKGVKDKVVTYTLKDGKLNTVEAVEKITKVTEEKITAKSTLMGKYFASTAVAFVKDKDGKYTVVTADKLAGMAVTKDEAFFVEDGKGQIAVLWTGKAEATADSVYGIYTGEWTETKDGFTLSFYVDGEPTTFASANTSFTKGAFLELGFTGEKVDSTKTKTVDGVELTTGGALTGSTYVDKKDKTVAFDKEVVVFIVTTNDKGEFKSLAKGTLDDLKKDTNTKIMVYDVATTDKAELYDVVVITR